MKDFFMNFYNGDLLCFFLKYFLLILYIKMNTYFYFGLLYFIKSTKNY